MFEWFYQLVMQFVTMVLSWFGMDAKALLGESFKEQAPESEDAQNAVQNVVQNVVSTLNEGEQ